MATQPQPPAPDQRRSNRLVPRREPAPRLAAAPAARRAPAPAQRPQPEPAPELEPVADNDLGAAPEPHVDRDAQRKQEVDALRQQYGGCIWRVWVRVESANRLLFTPIYVQVDAEDRTDGTTVIRHAGRSWVFQTSAVDTEVLGLERAIEERWITREEYRAFLY
jgi:hypothetical protein